MSQLIRSGLALSINTRFKGDFGFNVKVYLRRRKAVTKERKKVMRVQNLLTCTFRF